MDFNEVDFLLEEHIQGEMNGPLMPGSFSNGLSRLQQPQSQPQAQGPHSHALNGTTASYPVIGNGMNTHTYSSMYTSGANGGHSRRSNTMVPEPMQNFHHNQGLSNAANYQNIPLHHMQGPPTGNLYQAQPALSQSQTLQLMHANPNPPRRLNSSDARIEDFLNSLPYISDASNQFNSTDVHLLSEEDPQSRELNQLVKELEESTKHLLPQSEVRQIKTETPEDPTTNERRIQEIVKRKLTPLVCANATDVSATPHTDNVARSIKRNPTITDILLNGSEDDEMYGPITPLKNKPQSPTCDLEGSLLLLQNAHNIPTPLLLPAFSTVINNELSLKASASAPSTPASGKDQQVQDAKQVSESSEAESTTKPSSPANECVDNAACAVPENTVVVVSSPESQSNHTDCETAIAILNENSSGKSKNAINAKQNREKKKLYIKSIEAKLQRSLDQNEQLTSMTANLQKENEKLKKENDYLKRMVTNQESITEIVRQIPNSPELAQLAQSKRITDQCGNYTSAGESQPKLLKSCHGSPELDMDANSFEDSYDHLDLDGKFSHT